MNSTLITPATSVAHQHIVAVINSLLTANLQTPSVRILDVGCGDGKLLSHMLQALSSLRPDLHIEVFGVDVEDAGQQDIGFIERTIHTLQEKHPHIEWTGRVRIVSSDQRWPFGESEFDFLTSNQVLEHVLDHHFLFEEIYRCLRRGGVSVNLFPGREILWEGHALMPMVHRIADVKRRERAMYTLALIGFRRHYYREMERRGWKSIREFAYRYARVLESDTNYRTTAELEEIANGVGFRVSFDYTKDFFIAKALSYGEIRRYAYKITPFIENIGYRLGRRLASTTMLLHKD